MKRIQLRPKSMIVAPAVAACLAVLCSGISEAQRNRTRPADNAIDRFDPASDGWQTEVLSEAVAAQLKRMRFPFTKKPRAPRRTILSS